MQSLGGKRRVRGAEVLKGGAYLADDNSGVVLFQGGGGLGVLWCQFLRRGHMQSAGGGLELDVLHKCATWAAKACMMQTAEFEAETGQ